MIRLEIKRKAILRTIAVFLISGLLAAIVIAQASAATSHRHGRRHPAAAATPEPAVPLSQIYVLGDRPAPFVLAARAALLVAAHSGTVLYAYNEHEKMQPASLAKIMTFYLTLKGLREGRLKLDTQVPISETAWRLSMNRSVSRMFLEVGQKVSVKDLLYGLMVSSGNDAAVALAEYQAGSVEAFTEKMNTTARELGLNETQFANPDGLPVPGEYTTAADMAKLVRTVIEQYPGAITYTAAKEFVFHNIKQPNFNTLLFHDPRVDGFKTGHVEEAGYHLVATARQEGTELISAVMGTPSPEKRRLESEKLLDWGFRTFVTVHPDLTNVLPATFPVYQGAVHEVAIAPENDPYVTVGRGEERKPVLVSSFDSKYLVAPIPKGKKIGTLTVMVDGKQLASIPIQTSAAVPAGGFFHRFTDRIRMML